MPQVLEFPTWRRANSPQEITLQFLVADYTSFLVARRKTASVAGARSAFRRISKLLPLPWQTITRKVLEDYHRGDESPVAANRCLEYLRAAWNYAERRGHVPKDSNPLLHLSDFRAQETPRGVIVPDSKLPLLLEEITRLRATSGHAGPFQPDAVLLILLTGMRRGECEALKWEGVRPGHLIVTGKSGERMVPLSTDAEEILAGRRYRELGGKVFQGVDLRRTWDRIRRGIGLEGVTIHDLRRTHAVALLSTGKCDLSEVAKILGHHSTRITNNVYSPMQISRAKALSQIACDAILRKGGDE